DPAAPGLAVLVLADPAGRPAALAGPGPVVLVPVVALVPAGPVPAGRAHACAPAAIQRRVPDGAHARGRSPCDWRSCYRLSQAPQTLRRASCARRRCRR